MIAEASDVAQYMANLEEVRRQKARFADMEARLMVLTQDFTDHDMGDREEEAALCRSSKKMTTVDGTAQSSLTPTSSHAYAPPASSDHNLSAILPKFCKRPSTPASNTALTATNHSTTPHPPPPSRMTRIAGAEFSGTPVDASDGTGYDGNKVASCRDPSKNRPPAPKEGAGGRHALDGEY